MIKNRIFIFYCALLVLLAACQSTGATDTDFSSTVNMPATQPAPTEISIQPTAQDTAPAASHTPPAQITATQASIRTATDCERQWLDSQDPEELACALKAYQEVVEQSDREEKPYNQFLMDRLLWRSGSHDEEVRERILAFIRQNFWDGSAKEPIEFFWSAILPYPTYFDAGERLVIYDDGSKRPYVIVDGPGASMAISDTFVPGNLYLGKSAPALEIDWVKDAFKWDSLIIGFDERIADRSIAQAGELISLANPESYRLEFVIKAGAGLHLWDDAFIRIKLQDQNLLIEESIGNQLVCHIRVTEDWEAYSIPLTEFMQDIWVYKESSLASGGIWGEHPSLAFDWTRVKQINIDVPYKAHGQGIFFMDNIALVRNDASSAGLAEKSKAKTICLPPPP